LFTDTSEHIRFLLFSFSVFPLFSRAGKNIGLKKVFRFLKFLGGFLKVFKGFLLED